MRRKQPATYPRPSTSSRGQTGSVINDSDEHPRGAAVPPSIDHGRRPRPVIRPPPRFPPRFGGPLRHENRQAAPRPGIQAGVPPRPGIQAGVFPRPGSLPPGPAPERPGEARPQITPLYPATGAPCTFWSPSARDQICPWRIIVPVPLLGPPESEGDHEQAAHAPVSEEEEALLQEGGLVAAERSEAIIAELEGDGHNNVVNQDQLEIIEEGAAMDGSTAQVKNDETPAVEMMDDMDAIVAFQKRLDDFWDAVLHDDDQAGDDGNVEVSNIDGEAHAQPVLAQLGDVNISDQGDANVELIITDDHHELHSDNIANVVVDNGSGGILHGAVRGDHQEAGDVIAAHDYAAVEVVKDDEVMALREQSQPVGDQQAAGDVHGGDGTIAEQPAENVDDASAGDGLPMHNGDDIFNNEFPPLGQQAQQQRRGQAVASSSTYNENRNSDDLIGIILPELRKWEESKKKGNEEKCD